jgi:hypothetical protein
MKINRIGTFTLGVIVTAVSVSAVSYVNALNDQTMRACADRRTGAMRYIDKGRCKRTERSLTWNQVGPQGLQGIQGVQGAKGETSASEAQSGTSVSDKSGNYVGKLVGIFPGVIHDTFYIARDGFYFQLGSDGGVYGQVYFTQDNCTGTPFISLPQWHRTIAQNLVTVTLALGSTSAKFFEFSSNTIGSPLTPKSQLADNSSFQSGVPQLDGRGSCVNIDWNQQVEPSRILREIPPPFALDTTGPLRLSTPQR